MAFVNPNNKSFQSVKSSSDETLAIEYFNNIKDDSSSSSGNEYSVKLDIEVSLSKKTPSTGFELVKVTNDPNAWSVQITDAEFKQRYPWAFSTLTRQLRKKIPGFKQNAKYHNIRKKFEKLPNLCKTRFLDPDNPKVQLRNGIIPILRKK